MPVPNGFVRTNTSPSFASEFLINLVFFTSPLTTKPYLGSLSSIEWPPTMGMPASWVLSYPPLRIADNISFDNLFIGKPIIFNANKGFAPIA